MSLPPSVRSEFTCVRVWLDIENPPQVQYLTPFRAAFERAGASVLVTARDYGITLELLRGRGESMVTVGGEFGKGTARKGIGVAGRAAGLGWAVRRGERPLLILSSSRPSALVGWALRIPAFIFCDYEYAELGLYRAFGSHIVHPDTIPAEAFLARGFPPERLISFPGLKEDISFASGAREADPLPELASESLTRVLFRPPAEHSHYYAEESGRLSRRLLSHLAQQDSVRVVFSPRYAWQSRELQTLEWRNQPFVLHKGVPFRSLLASVDLVVSSGGTMVREAAYLGLPAYSILQSAFGAVDRQLAEAGRLIILRGEADFARLRLARLGRRSPMRTQPDLVHDLVDRLISRAHSLSRPSG